MAIEISNGDIKLIVEHPSEGYSSSRFDRTGKIIQVSYQGMGLASQEKVDEEMDEHCGKGFFNEFGMDSPLGFDEAEVDERFLKIGVGRLLKEDEHYYFLKKYNVKPVAVQLYSVDDEIDIKSWSEELNGYAYELSKIIRALPSGFEIEYSLKNTGERTIDTSEYNHNFISLDGRKIGPEYVLSFENEIDIGAFKEYVDNENIIQINAGEITFSSAPTEDFFIQNIKGIDGNLFNKWSLKNSHNGLSITEVLEGPSLGVNLWGWGHVISPEIFVSINIKAGETQSWKRRYSVKVD